MDAKLAWFERFLTWNARTKNTGAGPDAAPVATGPASTTDTSVQRERDDDFVVEVLPDHGAFAVRGPNYHGSDDDDDEEDDDVSGGGGGDDEASDDAPLRVDSYVVRERLTDDEIRERILAGTARAEAVEVVPPDDGAGKPGRRFGSAQRLLLLLAGAVALSAAIAVGVAVPLAARRRASAPAVQPPDEDVVASLRYLEWQGSGGFASAMVAESRRTTTAGAANGSLFTSGAVELIKCRPAVCAENDENCLVGEKTYEPGCCAGPGCPAETKCGEYCPKPPDSCYLTDPDNATCVRSSCYTCHTAGGEDLYRLTDYAWAVDCLEAGTAIRPDNGEAYRWAIFCGPVTVGPVPEENRDLGEYQCAATRLGANYSDDRGGLLSVTYPCQFIALAECGCGPPDMNTFGLPAPTGPCLPNGTCPFLCEDAGGTYASNLCRAFPGNVSWWEGRNAFNTSLFDENIMAQDYELEIYIRGVDD
jgi:hypothetical protein